MSNFSPPCILEFCPVKCYLGRDQDEELSSELNGQGLKPVGTEHTRSSQCLSTSACCLHVGWSWRLHLESTRSTVLKSTTEIY